LKFGGEYLPTEGSKGLQYVPADFPDTSQLTIMCLPSCSII